MADPAVEQQVRDIICEKLSVSPDQVTPETSFVNDIGADSLDLVELIMELEDKFDTKIPDEEAEKILTVGDAIAYIDGATCQGADGSDDIIVIGSAAAAGGLQMGVEI